MDKNHPGWERRVDTSILDISDPDSCICGQVFSFTAVCKDFHVNHDSDESSSEAIGEHGFLYPEDGDAWVDLLKMRFDHGVLSDS